MRILAACSPGEVRVAVTTPALLDYAIWRPGRPDGVGDLHRGRVIARARALGGSFVALDGADGFLPDSEQTAPASAGDIITVRITRAAQGGKGPRLTRLPDLAPGAPTGLLSRGPGAVERFAAQYLTADILIDDAAVAVDLRPQLSTRLRLTPRAFDADLEDQLAELSAAHAPSPGGGTLHIQPTSALIAIDIDTAGALPAHTKAAAAHAGFNAGIIPELARQIRLRNLSGAILVDFAGLSAKRRAKLAAPLRDALAADPVECRLVGFTGLGLAEIVRRRIHPPLHELLTGPHAAAAAALRAAITQSARALYAAPDLLSAYEQDDVMRDDLARSAAHGLIVRSDPSLPSCTWRLDEHRRSAS